MVETMNTMKIPAGTAPIRFVGDIDIVGESLCLIGNTLDSTSRTLISIGDTFMDGVDDGSFQTSDSSKEIARGFSQIAREFIELREILHSTIGILRNTRLSLADANSIGMESAFRCAEYAAEIMLDDCEGCDESL